MTNFDLKSGAVIALLIDSAQNYTEITDELNYLYHDLEMTDDGYSMTLSLASQAATLAILLANMIQQDATELWAAIMSSDGGYLDNP